MILIQTLNRKRIPSSHLNLRDFSETTDGRAGGSGGGCGDGVGTTGNSLLAALALPDTNSLALDGVLSAEGADVAGVLGDFHLLHLLTQGGTVSGTIFTRDTDLLSALGHLVSCAAAKNLLR